MIDRGLLLTIVAVIAVIGVLARTARPDTVASSDVFDAVAPAALAGLAVGRIVAMALDDPSALTRLRDVLLIRGGVELWPGVAAGAFVLALSARRAGVDVVRRLADLAPYALAAYAVYEALCLVRDGCFGPRTSIGLRPGGLGTAQFPVGVAVGVAVGLLAVAVRRDASRRPLRALLLAAGGVALVRAVASFWLPKIGSGPTRQHVESMLVAGGVALASLVVLARGSRVDRASVESDELS